MKRYRMYAAAVVAVIAGQMNAIAANDDGNSWVTSWHASPQPVWQGDFILPTHVPERLHEQTVREIVRISRGGRRIRVMLSNRYGKTPVVFADVHVAKPAAASAVQDGSDKLLRFGGLRSVVVPPGASVVSDPLEMEVAPLSRLAVSSYFPQPTALDTFHWGAQQTGYIAAGNVTDRTHIDVQHLLKGRAFLTSVLVEVDVGVDADVGTRPQARTVVAFGDSITDGNGSTPDRDRRWPDFLAERLAAHGVAVANAGISGERLLGSRMGENALARFADDVLGQPGVKTVVLLIGINDIGWPGSPFAPHEQPVTAGEMIAGYRQLIAQAHLRNVRIVGATLPPFEGALRGTPFEGHYSIDKERLRREINQWIRSAGEFDAVADFDALLRDPGHPSRMLPEFDSGDHLHPGDAGYKAMADMLDMATLFGSSSPQDQ